MLFSIFPIPFVLSTILPFKSPITLSLIVHKTTHVFFAVSPRETPLSVHLILVPLTYIVLIRPGVLSTSSYFIEVEVTFVNAAIRKCERAIPFLFPISVVPFILCSIWPDFGSKTTLFVVNPFSVIDSAICVEISALSISFIIIPVSLIKISICMVKFTVATSYIIFPVTLVTRAIWPKLDSPSILFVILNITSIFCIASLRQVDMLLRHL